jgi:hypothetical protein
MHRRRPVLASAYPRSGARASSARTTSFPSIGKTFCARFPFPERVGNRAIPGQPPVCVSARLLDCLAGRERTLAGHHPRDPDEPLTALHESKMMPSQRVAEKRRRASSFPHRPPASGGNSPLAQSLGWIGRCYCAAAAPKPPAAHPAQIPAPLPSDRMKPHREVARIYSAALNEDGVKGVSVTP